MSRPRWIWRDAAGVPLYAVAVTASNNSAEISQLGEIARKTGGRIFKTETNELTSGFEELNSYIQSYIEVEATISAELADGNVKGLVLSVTDGDTVTDDRDIRVNTVTAVQTPEPEVTKVPQVVVTAPPPTEPPAPTPEPVVEEPEKGMGIGIWIIIAVTVIAVCGVVVFIAISSKKKRNGDELILGDVCLLLMNITPLEPHMHALLATP